MSDNLEETIRAALAKWAVDPESNVPDFWGECECEETLARMVAAALESHEDATAEELVRLRRIVAECLRMARATGLFKGGAGKDDPVVGLLELLDSRNQLIMENEELRAELAAARAVRVGGDPEGGAET